MATVTLSKEVFRKFDSELTCAICLNRYTDPRILPCCYHTLCKDCIDRLPKEVVQADNERRRYIIRCPLCCQDIQLSELGASAFMCALYISMLLEIEELLKMSVSQLCYTHGGNTKHIYCETCQCHICIQCSIETHHDHLYGSAEDLFPRHKEQIKACLLRLQVRMFEVEETLIHFDTKAKKIREQGEVVLNEIDDTYQQLTNQLQCKKVDTIYEQLLESRKKLSQEVSSALHEKLKLHFLQKAQVQGVLVQLKSCHEFVLKEQSTQSWYQIQAAKNQLVKRINATHSEVKVSELQPAQDLNILFTANRNALSEGGHIGNISCIHSFSCPGLCSVEIPSRVMKNISNEVLFTAPIPLSASRVCCQLTAIQSRHAKPVVCPVISIGEGLFCVRLQSSIAGLHHLRVLVDGVDIHSSPFSVHVDGLKRSNLMAFAKSLDGPCGVAVTDDGQHVVVTEWGGHCITVFFHTGEVVRRIASFGSGLGKFEKPWGVTVSADKQIIVTDPKNEMLQKFPLFSVFSSLSSYVNLSGYGVAVHPVNGKVFVTSTGCNIEVLNADLTHSHTIQGSKLDTFYDVALDTKDMVYVTNPDRGVVLKFTPEGKHLATIGSKGEQPHQFTCPLGICIDSNDIMYVTDSEKHVVMIFTVDGQFLESVSRLSNSNLFLRGVAVDMDGNLYVCDVSSGEVLVSRETASSSAEAQSWMTSYEEEWTTFSLTEQENFNGIHVIGERIFEINGRHCQQLEWEEFGFRMICPKNATAHHVGISVKAIIVGEFEFPEGTELVSALYAISASRRLDIPVVIEVEHCVQLENEEDCKYMCFGIAEFQQKNPPYTFRIIETGIFSPRSKFGKIQRASFSIAAILKKLPAPGDLDTPASQSDASSGTSDEEELEPDDDLPEMNGVESVATEPIASAITTDLDQLQQTQALDSEATASSCGEVGLVCSATAGTQTDLIIQSFPVNMYIAQIFLECQGTRRFSWKFAVAKDLKALNTFTRESHRNWQECSYFRFEFTSSRCLLLEIPHKCESSGWTICPEVLPCEISQTDVDIFWRDNSLLPWCAVTVIAKTGEAEFLNYPVVIRNIKPEKTVHIQCSLGCQEPKPILPDDSAPKINELLNMIANKALDKWEILGLQLDIEPHRLKSIKNQTENNVLRYAEIFEIWKRRGNPPFTWATIIDALKAPIVEEQQLAHELEKCLPC